MAEENDAVMAEVVSLLESKPAAALPSAGPDIPALNSRAACDFGFYR